MNEHAYGLNNDIRLKFMSSSKSSSCVISSPSNPHPLTPSGRRQGQRERRALGTPVLGLGQHAAPGDAPRGSKAQVGNGLLADGRQISLHRTVIVPPAIQYGQMSESTFMPTCLSIPFSPTDHLQIICPHSDLTPDRLTPRPCLIPSQVPSPPSRPCSR